MDQNQAVELAARLQQRIEDQGGTKSGIIQRFLILRNIRKQLVFQFNLPISMKITAFTRYQFISLLNIRKSMYYFDSFVFFKLL